MSRSTARADADASSIATATVVNPPPQSDGSQRGSDDLQGSYTSIPTNELRTSSNSAKIATKIFPNEPNDPRPQIYQPLGTLGTLRVWSFEIMALVVSAAAFLTIVAVLYKLDEELQPELAYDLNVNTLIAIFSVMLRATLLYVMAEVIGQSKWLWLKSARSLRDLKYFHDAGQGAGGSIRFLFFSWKPILTIAGVFVIIASYAIGPFSQQAAKTYFCQKKVEGGTARIAVAEWYGYTRSPYMYNIQVAEIEAVIINGLIFDAADSTFKSMFTCTTGNCTFDATGGVTHTSIGFCSACNDVTSSLQRLDRSQEVLYQSQTDPKFNLTYSLKTADVWKAKVFDLRINCKSEETDPTDSPEETCTISIATFKNRGCVSSNNDTHSGAVKRGCGDLYESILYANADIDFAAANCTVYSCLRSYNATVVNGILKERVVSSAPTQNASNVLKEEGRRNRTRAYHGFVKPCVIDGKLYNELNISKATRDENWVSWRTRDGIRGAPRQCLRAIDHSHYWTAMMFQQESLPGSCRLWYEDDHGPLDPTVNPIDTDRMVIDCDDRWWLDALHRSGNATFESISAAIDSMTTSLTNHMRIRGENWEGTSSGFVTGSVMQAAICVQVDWFWLAYPAALLCITTILLAIACVQSYQSRERQPVWKSAILPLLFYNVETEQRRKYSQQQDRGDSVPLLQLKELEKLASQTVARFETRVGDVGFAVEDEDEKEVSSAER